MVSDDEIPTFANCDPADPEEFALPAFVAMPHMRGAPLLMPISYWRHMCQRLWDLGFRQVEPPTLKYRPPLSAADPFIAQGEWVDIDEPGTEDDKVAEVVARLGPGLRRRVADEINKQMED